MSEGFSLKGKKIWIAGHRGLIGSALMRRLASENCEILTVSRAELDLSRQQPVEDWLMARRPDAIFVTAGRVGGIHANTAHPAAFIYENIAIEANIIEAARRADVAKLLFLGSSCIYPRLAPQPIPENALLSGALEPTNQWYAIAKIAGVKMAQAYRREFGCDFISAMPTNLYGPADNFDVLNGHVLPSLLRRLHEAKTANAPEIVIWGTGAAQREFLHADDCADALTLLMNRYSDEEPVNVGSGEDISILELTHMVAEVVGYAGAIRTDPSKPDGPPRKLLSVTKLHALGWKPRITLKQGILHTYRWFLDNHATARGVK